MRLFAIFTGVLLAWLAIRTMSGRAAAPETSYGFKVAGAVALAGLMGTAAALRLLRAAPNAMGRLVAGPVIVAFAIGWLAWLPDWLNFGLDRAHFAVRVPASVASGLAQLRRTTLPGSRIATNQHALASIPNRPERSYFYGALSERPVMLEGWQNGEKLHPSFSAVRRDADSLFSTTDAASFLAIVRRHHVEYIVAAPGTDVGLPEPRPRWLRRLPVDGVVAYAVAAD
jgi:hypothetical protein